MEGQVQSELVAKFGTSAKVELLTRDQITQAHLHRFVRVRRAAGKAPPQDTFYGLKITFDEQVSGPLVLGYGSHFGLGLFVPVLP